MTMFTKMLKDFQTFVEEFSMMVPDDAKKILSDPEVSHIDLYRLVGSEDPHVRYEVALHPKSDFKILNRLYEISRRGLKVDHTLQMKIAQNRNCPVEILERLSRSPSVYTRNSVVMNQSTPRDVLEVMKELENNEFVLDSLNKRLNKKRSK